MTGLNVISESDAEEFAMDLILHRAMLVRELMLVARLALSHENLTEINLKLIKLGAERTTRYRLMGDLLCGMSR